MFQSRGVFKSAWPVRYRVGKASERISSLPDASSIGICRIDGAGRPAGSSLQPVISSRIRLASVVSWSRLKTADSEVGGVSPGSTGVSVCSTDPSSLRASSVIYITDEETSLSTGRAAIQSVEIVI
jgi:hypothetical protein